MKKTFITSAILASCLIVLTACSSVVNQFAFYPDTQNIIPAEKLPPGVEEIFITTNDHVKLQAYYVKNPASDRILIFFHGNAGNICHRLSDIGNLKNCGINVLAISYRGYGKSSGKPSEKGIYSDGAAAINYATRALDYSLHNIMIFGRSIGTTVAVHTSQNKDIAGLILITPLTSAKAHAKAQGLGFLSFLAGNAFDNLSKISNIRCPLLVIHGTEDKVLPFFMGREIFDHANVEKRLVIINGAGHNNLSQTDPAKYWGAIAEFIRKVDRLKVEG
ncbi:MAG: alpha/beta hydrolase [Desulfobacteraceae bacterium]|nr:alpha/beta hydrolase [Desulfobacteraceae bacterium]MBC2756866.1 alpha/beta hydrolase [Desulfobacteraceae bacterium]